MQLMLARFPQCKPRCISSNINENLFSRGAYMSLDLYISSCWWHADFQFEERVGAMVRQRAARERAEGGRSWRERLQRSAHTGNQSWWIVSLNFVFHCQLNTFRFDEDNCSGQTLDPLVKKPASQSAAVEDLRGAEEKKEENLLLKAALSPHQIRVRLLSFLDNMPYY